MIRKSRIFHKSMEERDRMKIVDILFGILLFCVFLTIGFLPVRDAGAAGATITVSTGNNTVTEGDTVYVLITVSATENMKSFEGRFTYDNRYLQFVTGGSVVHGNDDAFRISDIERTSSASEIKYSIKFKARKKGNTSIVLKKPYSVRNDDGDQMSVSYNTLNIVVKSPGEINATKKPKKNKEVKVTASPKPESEKVQKDLPSATQKTEKMKKSKENTDKQKKKAKNVKLQEKDGKKYLVANTKIELMDVPEGVEIPKDFQKTYLEINEKTIPAYALGGGTEHDFVLIYGKASEEEFYLYDKKEESLMPYDKVKGWYRSVELESEQLSAAKRTITSYKYMLGIVGVLCILMFLGMIGYAIKARRYREMAWEAQKALLEYRETDDMEM